MSAAEAVYIALGSNQDDPEKQISGALKAIASHPDIALQQASRLYRTPPWGVLEQPPFINAAARLDTRLSPEVLMEVLIAIEHDAGRIRERRWGPRILDLDLLLYGARSISSQRLTLPHPHLHERAFVLVPLLEIAPDVAIPGLGRADRFLAALDCSGIEAIG